MLPSMKKTILGLSTALFMSGTAVAGTLVINSDLSDPAPRAAFEQLVKDFEAKHPDIKVRVNTYDKEGYKSAIRNFLTADAPDLATWYAGNRMAPFVEANLFEDVSDVWAQNGLNEDLKSAAGAMTMNGKKWGIPLTYYQWGLYVRADIFKANGVGPIRTFDDLVNACKTLRAKNITPIAIGTKALWPAAGWFDYLNLRTNGYQFHMDLTAGKIPYTDPRVKETFANWRKLVDAKCFLDNHAGLDWQDAIPNFVQGRAAMYLMGNFAVAPMRAGGLKDDQIDFVQFPPIKPGVPMAEEAPIDTIHITARAKNKADARKFLAFVASPEAQTKLNIALGQLPVNRKSTVPDDKFLKAGQAMLQNAQGLAQFFDRDARAEVAKAGMEGFQEFMLRPDNIDRILERLERVRQRAHTN